LRGSVVIAGDRERYPRRIAVGIDHRHDRNAESVGLFDRQLLLYDINHEDHVGQAAHLADAAKRALQLVALTRQHQDLLFGEALNIPAETAVHFLETLDAARNRLPVGQHAAQPTMVDVILTAAGRSLGDILRRGLLCSNEQHATAACHRVANRPERTLEHWNGLLQVQDMNLVPDPEDVRCHARIPAPRVVTKMNACFKQLAQ